MKKLLFPAMLLFVLDATAQYELEKRIWGNLLPIYAQTGLDVDVAFSRMEDYFIKEDMLRSRDANGYLEFLQHKRLTQYPSFIDSIRNNMVSFAMAFELYYLQEFEKDSSFVKASKIYLLKQALQKEELNMDDYQQLFRNKLTGKDLNNRVYQFMCQLVMINVIPFNSAAKLLDASSPKSTEVSTEDILSITIDANDSIYCNGRPVSKMELFALAESHLYRRKSTAVIVMLYSPNSSYEYYMVVFNGLKHINEQLREQYAQKQFHKPYTALSAKELETVKAMYPFVVSEIVMEDE